MARTFFYVFMIRQMLEPGILGGTVPVFYLCRDGNDGAGSHLLRLLAQFLIPAATCDANQHLHLFVMDMPVVTAARLEGDVVYTTAYVGQIAVTEPDCSEVVPPSFVGRSYIVTRA